MINDLQHIQLDDQKSKQEPALHEQEVPTAAFSRLKALKPTYSQQDIETSITLILVLAFLPIYRALYYYVCVALGPFVNMLDFQQPKKVLLST
jgi:hypothetical protein